MARLQRLPFILLVLAAVVLAHEHHDEGIPAYDGNNPFANEAEMDRTMKWHIGLQMATWGVGFPLGMILGMNKSRWHVPVQSLTVVLTLSANYLAHHHHGRAFRSTAHSGFATYLKWYLLLQTCAGIFLKLHLLQHHLMRRWVVRLHSVVGKTFPVVGFAQMVMGGIASLGFCFGEHFGQCLAHFIMGSSFIVYAIFLLIMLRVGGGWLARKNISQEYLDSWVICVWGAVNTFTEHDFLRASGYWSHKDMQHVSLGVLWWAGGALGIFLGRNGRRNLVPGLIIIFTGYAMSEHAQAFEFSTNVHKLFGWSLMSAGLSRIIEIAFVLADAPSPPPSTASVPPRAWQHLPPYLLVLSGLTFMSATEEQLGWVARDIGMDSTTYANGLFSTAFVIYLVAVAMMEIYQRTYAAKLAREDIAARGGLEVDAERGQASVHVLGVRVPIPRAVLQLPEVFTPAFWADPQDPAAGQDSYRPLVSRPLSDEASEEDGSVEMGEVSASRNGRVQGHTRDESEVFSLGVAEDEEDDDEGDLGGEARQQTRDAPVQRQHPIRVATPARDSIEDDGGDGYWDEKESRTR